MAAPRFAIGIDLGTSNSVLAYVDLLAEPSRADVPTVTVLDIPQRDATGVERLQPVLPSVLFIPPVAEPGVLPEVGQFARDQAEYLPGRVVQSAKSWLAYGMMESRENACLPWGSEEIPPEERWSPVDASAVFLRTLKEAWDRQIASHTAEYSFASQDITVTVPASFDEAATRLTLEAASRAGFPGDVRLLEEPQAAFYSWLGEPGSVSELSALLREHGATGADSVQILVCDVGGGTSDFSLFGVTPDASGAPLPVIRRLAVSDHLLLGGDNIDLALALECESRLTENATSLTPSQRSFLLFQARRVKEELLADDVDADDDRVIHIALPGTGQSLFASARSAPVARKMLRSMVLDGFFPFCEADAVPAASVTGLREWGLPYVADSAITRHLAHFLRGRRVDAVLFAGGTLTPSSLRARVADVIESWQGRRPRILAAPRMELAIAEGAAYYGFLSRTARRRIEADYGRTLYVELFRDNPDELPSLLCIMPRGVRVNERVRLTERRFHLLAGRRVRFQIYSSTARENDAPGQIVRGLDETLTALPPVETMIEVPGNPAGAVEVEIEAVLNELGRLELYCVSVGDVDDQKWQLTFNLRREHAALAERAGAGDAAAPAALDDVKLREASAAILALFGKKKTAESDSQSPKRLVANLERIIGVRREEWSPPVLRSMWMPLAEGMTRRGRSLAHETAWLALAGFLLRPGYGYPGDDARVRDLWRVFQLGLSFPKEAAAVTQWWIMWRRVSGGLPADAQRALFAKLRNPLREKRGDLPEMARLASSLERLTFDDRREIGDQLLTRITARTPVAVEHLIWSLGRLASRTGAYAGSAHVLPRELVEPWCERILQLDWQAPGFGELSQFAAEACRVVNDPRRDVDDRIRLRMLERMRATRATGEQIRRVEQFIPLDRADIERLYGEELPAGLILLE